MFYSYSPFGYEGALCGVEAEARRGIPCIDVVGLADGSVMNTRRRIREAVQNCGLSLPAERLLVSISPADLRKEEPFFDLALALAVLNPLRDSDPAPISQDILVIGEIETSGKIRPLSCSYAAALSAFTAGIKFAVAPKVIAEQIRRTGLSVLEVENLAEANKYVFDFSKYKEATYSNSENIEIKEIEQDNDLPKEYSDYMVRSIEIAVAGRLNVLEFGKVPSYSLVSLAAALLPDLSQSEAETVAKIYSVAGIKGTSENLSTKRPVRMPHQTATIEGMCGGGLRCHPGEISLAHNGLLFLDYASEFRTSVLQMLRVPLESGQVTLSRAGRSTIFPADFQLIMSTQSCPCGNFGEKNKTCLCSKHSIDLYWSKFSEPLLNRMEIKIHYINSEETKKSIETISSLKSKIEKAVKIQKDRQGKQNTKLNMQEIEKFCSLDKQSDDFLKSFLLKRPENPRNKLNVLKIARTIADLAEHCNISIEDIKEAVSFYNILPNEMN